MTGTGQGLGGRLCSVASYDGLSQNYIDPTAEFTDDETFQTTDYTQSVPLNEYDGTSINGSNPFSSSESYPNSSPSNVFSPDPATSDSRTEDFPSERRHHASLFSNAIEQPSSETVTTVHGPGSTDLSPQWLQDRPWSEWDGENGQETGIQSTGLFNPLLYPSTATLTAVEQIPVTRPEAVPTLDINGSSPAFNNIGFWTATTGFTGTNPVLQPRTGRNNFVPKRFETSGDWRYVYLVPIMI
ncbi:hypothetical protein P152DRAFT_39569 [Eremomyces bilateralis CBS 781.70]|uniref:Uncharacterized protein n=1 Tax=Eremomyces bilateralis CBS 781.70 TaxID=1392243 RepID=A0A6G1G1U9_9PEZI|nr:uncharacterized protein P152DRAFT_39569 [Eremomyces bilateralis CBS 781.70]KAF1811962.1 hypothetical protein P152DRAFT_39569 [Eremomyces bilateralis CBS 781.70]